MIIAAAILWGFDGVVLTPRLFNLDVGLVVFILHLLPFCLMNLFLYREYRHLAEFNRSDFLIFFLIALFGGSLGTIAIVRALFLVNFQHLSLVVLLQKLQPIFALILARIILREIPGRKFIFWAFLAIAASYFLTFGLDLPHLKQDANLIQAALWALIAAFSFGSSTVFSKVALKKYTFYTTNFYRFGFTTVIMFIYVLLSGKLPLVNQITSINLMYFIIIALTTGSGAIFLYYLGLKRVKASISTICELFFPVSAIFFDFIFNDNRLSLIQWLSAMIMIIAILKISLNKRLVR